MSYGKVRDEWAERKQLLWKYLSELREDLRDYAYGRYGDSNAELTQMVHDWNTNGFPMAKQVIDDTFKATDPNHWEIWDKVPNDHLRERFAQEHLENRWLKYNQAILRLCLFKFHRKINNLLKPGVSEQDIIVVTHSTYALNLEIYCRLRDPETSFHG